MNVCINCNDCLTIGYLDAKLTPQFEMISLASPWRRQHSLAMFLGEYMPARRISAMALSVTMAFGALQLMVTSPASATSCSLGAKRTVWSKAKKPYRMIGLKTITLAPHVSYSDEVTLERTATFTGSVTASAEVSAEFKVAILAKLGAKVSLQLQGVSSSTNKLTMTESFTIPGSESQQTYVLYKGVRRASGNWKWQECQKVSQAPDSRTWTTLKSGKAKSWNHGYIGVINCATSQKDGSIQAIAKAEGC